VADEKVITLLEEIRDVQRLHLENQKLALRRQKVHSLLNLILIVAFLGFMAYMGWSAVYPPGH
jgi:hypothetical protein